MLLLRRIGWPSRRRFAAAALVGVVALAPLADAARPVRVGDVTVPLTGGAAFPEAMRIALVRMTGRRDAASDPVFAELIADASRYAQIVRPAGAGATQISFDTAAIERAVLAAGRPVWARNRAVVMVVIAQAPPGADAVAVRQALEDAGSARGLPLQLSSATSAGLSADSDAAAGLAAARRAGAEAVLLGRADAAGWQWTLHSEAGTQVFQGALTAGVQGAADALASGTVPVSGLSEAEAVVVVRGVRTLRDYAQTGRALASVPGVRNVSLLELDSESARYRLLARGGAEGLAAALSGSSVLRPDGADSMGLVLRFGP